LNANEYQIGTVRTMTKDIPFEDVILNCSMGLVGEGSEVMEKVKKHIFQGHNFDRENSAEELGDALYYLARFAYEIGYTLEEIMVINQNKLKKRFPNGFTVEDSIKRVDEQ
jgi:NTP pyrophosphatase (non-canonical NTP hydrolase)